MPLKSSYPNKKIVSESDFGIILYGNKRNIDLLINQLTLLARAERHIQQQGELTMKFL